ncbi:PEP-CTERM sorting domain-containing protein [Methylocaldum sp. MU1018]
MKNLKSRCSGILLALLTAGNAHAIFVTDVNPSDANRITSQGILIDVPGILSVYQVVEDYNETTLVPYPSHDGLAIVNPQGGFFDKVVDLENNDGWWTFQFTVTNTYRYPWSDYHFEFWDADFQNRLLEFPLRQSPGPFPQATCSNLIFLNDNCSGGTAAIGPIAEFWSPNEQRPGQTNDFRLTMNLDEIRRLYGNTFGIRQVATTPEPGTLALFGLGLGGFTLLRRRRSLLG